MTARPSITVLTADKARMRDEAAVWDLFACRAAAGA
jgi:hypothetical protein